MSARDIAAAIKALRRNDAVFGPAADGGFWLIGMKGPVPPQLFDGIRWSHEQTLADMKGAVNGSIAQLRRLNDVDDVEAYQDWKHGG